MTVGKGMGLFKLVQYFERTASDTISQKNTAQAH